MKRLLVLVLLLPTLFNAQVKSFDDLMHLNSESQFIKTCVENGYVLVNKGDYKLQYMNTPSYSGDELLGAQYWGFYCYGSDIYTGLKKNEWAFDFADLNYQRNYGICEYDIIYKQVKSKCKFYGIIELDYSTYNRNEKSNVVCYSCPGSTYNGKIGFLEMEILNTEATKMTNGIIFHLIPSLH